MGYDEDLADRLRVALQHEDGITEKRMFGGLAFLQHGHMAVAASGQGGLMVRCDPAASEELVRRPGAARMEMRGREVDGWLRVDAAAVEADDALADWVVVGTSYTRSLPPK